MSFSLAKAIAEIVAGRLIQLDQVADPETRLLFNGPPLEALGEVLDLLLASTADEAPAIPVLLVVPGGVASNPPVGTSGRCDANHLLSLRNSSQPSYLALIPPGQHNMMSVTSTTDAFGVATAVASNSTTFEEWWSDEFIQQVLASAIDGVDLPPVQRPDAFRLAEDAARAADEVEEDRIGRPGAWRVLSRLLASGAAPAGMSGGDCVALACGVPPKDDGSVHYEEQGGTLKRIAAALSDGFRAGIEGAKQDASERDADALDACLTHLRRRNDVQAAFDRATAAFYQAADGWDLTTPPTWWTTLTVERWRDLLADEPTVQGDLVVSCPNNIAPAGKGFPAIVAGEVELVVAVGEDAGPGPIELAWERAVAGPTGKRAETLQLEGKASVSDDLPPHKTPARYKFDGPGLKPGVAKVISLASWTPGVVVLAKTGRKISLPRKPRRGGPKGIDWETSLSLAGSGRHEILVFVADGIELEPVATGLGDESSDGTHAPQEIAVQLVEGPVYQAEIEGEGSFQLDIRYVRTGPDGKAQLETCRVQLTLEEVPEQGCRSEFERLIAVNRRNIDGHDKATVQLDRSARLASLQGWMLEKDLAARSFLPIVLADDYASCWVQPLWQEEHGPTLSKGRFLHDPRPLASAFMPPVGFIAAREEIAALVRGPEDHYGLVESAPLGSWMARDPGFRELVERYLDAYAEWLAADPDVAAWVDVILVTSLDKEGRTLRSEPDAIILGPLHPVRFAWHAKAQQVLFEADDLGRPCPAGSILDPGSIPDFMSLPLGSPSGIERLDFVSVETNADYWSVLWNGRQLSSLGRRGLVAPFDQAFGITIGGISSGFSSSQVQRALDDVSDLLSAKPVVGVALTSSGGGTDACNVGLIDWARERYKDQPRTGPKQGVGMRLVDIYDTRLEADRPDQATIANLSEETANRVRWFERLPGGVVPDLGIVAQLEASEARMVETRSRSPMSVGGLMRHRVRQQLPGSGGAFLSESRQARHSGPSGDPLADKLAAAIEILENLGEGRRALTFAPDANLIREMLNDGKMDFVAVSSSAIDPACFLGNWLSGAYLWDYDLPSYSRRAGDTNGYYLLSQVKDADRDSLSKVLKRLHGCAELADEQVENTLVEIARRGIPTVRGMAGEDTDATGNLGLFIAVRLLQDRFRGVDGPQSLLPVISGDENNPSIAIVVPVDPFRKHLDDLGRSLKKDGADLGASRPDLLVIGMKFEPAGVRVHLTPIEVKCRQGSTLSDADCRDALGQAKALSNLLGAMQPTEGQPLAWSLAYQHLLLAVVGYGMRVYSQHSDVAGRPDFWATLHERVATELLRPVPTVTIDGRGRLIVIDETAHSSASSKDGDGFQETIVIGKQDAGLIAGGDCQALYKSIEAYVGDWELMPVAPGEEAAATVPPPTGQPTGPEPVQSAATTPVEEGIGETQANEPQPEPVAAENGQVKVAATGGGIVLSVGTSTGGFQPRPLTLNISDTGLNQLNMGVVGDLGTGKTQLLKSLIYQITAATDANRGIKPRMLIFDYKRDYSSPEFVSATGARVVRPAQLPLNLFDTTTIGDVPAPWLDRFRFFADVLDKIYSGIGPVQRDKLKGAVKAAYDACSPLAPTIYDVHAAYKELLGGKSDSPLAIIDDLVDMEVFAKDPKATIPFDQFLDGVVVVSLDALGQDDRSKNMLVAVMLNMFYENMLRTPKRPFVGQDPQLRAIDSYLLVDEADNIMRYEFDVLRKLLLQGREFGTGIILASQYLRHFKVNATDYREPLLTWFVHKVPNVTAAELSALGLTQNLGELAERVKTLPNHHCLYKSFDVTGEVIRGRPFFELPKPG